MSKTRKPDPIEEDVVPVCNPAAKASPRTKRCETCEWWDHHKLTDMTGYCHKDPMTINKNSDSWCSFWQTKFR